MTTTDGPVAFATAGELKDFPITEKGRYFEDFHVKQRLVHHWGRTLTDTDSVLFNSLTLNYAPVFNNADFARSCGYLDRPLNPYLVFHTVLGLSVEDTSERDGGMFLAVNWVDFHETAYAGTTVTAESEVTAMRASQSRPTTGIVTWRTTGRRTDGTPLVTFERTNLVIRRSSR